MVDLENDTASSRRYYIGPAIVDNSPGEKVSMVAGTITGSPQLSLPITLWKLAWIEGDVLMIYYGTFNNTWFGQRLTRWDYQAQQYLQVHRCSEL